MRELWDLIWVGHNRGFGGVFQHGMFFLALLYLLTHIKKMKHAKIFLLYTGLFYLVFFFPITAFILMYYAMESDVYWRMFWVLPAYIVVGYLLVDWKYLLEKKYQQVAFVIVLASLLLLNPGWVKQGTTRAENMYHLPNVVIETIHVINDVEDERVDRRAVFPVDMHPYVRQYDASFLLLFNWNTTFKEQRAANLSGSRRLIYEMINYNQYNWNLLKTLLREEEVDYFIINRFEEGSVTLYPEFQIVAETEWLYIFKYVNLSDFEVVFEGIDYSPVYNYHFFMNKYRESIPELENLTQKEVLEYFVNVGMPRGLQGSTEFNLHYFMWNYPELVELFGDNYVLYYNYYIEAIHSMNNGSYWREHLVAYTQIPIFNGRDYSLVFNYRWFMLNYGNDPLISNMNKQEALEYFVTMGMDRGMQGSPFFDVEVYKRAEDLTAAFGDEIRVFYYHYMDRGFREWRKTLEENKRQVMRLIR